MLRLKYIIDDFFHVNCCWLWSLRFNIDNPIKNLISKKQFIIFSDEGKKCQLYLLKLSDNISDVY